MLVASFASNVHRMQQAVDVALESGRKVCVVGRSMRKNLNIARALGYMDVPDDALVKPDELDNYAPDKVLVLCTGSQGEPMSALTRIAYHDHPTVDVERGDTVIISAKAVPGNELRVHDTINQLARAGAEVLHHEIAPVHVSGHGNSEEIRTVIGLVRPKAVMPVHGEYRMLAAQARMAQDAGVPASSIVLAENGSVVELSASGVRAGGSRGLRRDVRRRPRRRRHLGRGASRPASPVGGRCRDRRRHALEHERPHHGAPELIARGFAEADELLEELRAAAGSVARRAARAEHPRDQAAPAAPPRRSRPARIRPDAAAAADPARGRGGLARGDRRDARLGGRAHAQRRRSRDRSPPRRPAPRLRGLGARVLPSARAVGARGRRAVLARQAGGGPPARRRPRRDRDRRARAAARAVPARARA